MRTRMYALLLPVICLTVLTRTEVVSQTWELGLTTGSLQSGFLYSDDTVLYAEGYRSYDLGKFWEHYFTISYMSSMAAHGDTVLIAEERRTRIGPNEGQFEYSGMYRITDRERGVQWLPTVKRMVPFVMHVGGGYFVIGVGDGINGWCISSLQRTGDGGETWEHVKGVGEWCGGTSDNNAATDGRGNGIVCTEESVYISHDSGGSWEWEEGFGGVAAAIYDRYHYVVATAVEESDSVVHSLRYVQEGDRLWLERRLPMEVGRVFTIAYGDRNHVLVGSDSGLYRMGLNDGVWEEIELPTSFDAIHEILVKGEVYVVATRSRPRIYRSEDEGRSWSLMRGFPAGWVTAFARVGDDGIVGARSSLDQRPYSREPGRANLQSYPVVTAVQNGSSWDDELGDEIRYQYIYSNERRFGIHPWDVVELGEIGMISADEQGVGFLPASGSEIFPVTDKSVEFIENVTGLPDGTWFAYDTAGRSYHGYCRSATDVHWEAKEPKIESAVMTAPNEYIAYGDGNVYATVDAGQMWEVRSQLSDGVGNLVSFADGTLAMIAEGGVRRSEDGGRSWLSSIPPDGSGRGIAEGAGLLVVEPSTLLLGCYSPGDDTGRWYQGLFRSDDRGESWYRWEEGLLSRQVHGLGYGYGGRLVVAADSLIYHTDQLSPPLRMGEQEREQEGERERAGSRELRVAYESRNDAVRIVWRSGGGRGEVQVEVLDMGGRVVKERRVGVLPEPEVTLSTGGLASGLYVVRVREEGGKTYVGKVVIVR